MAITGVMMGLLLPAVQHARETANRIDQGDPDMLLRRWLCLLAAALALGGCQKQEPPRSGGRTASYWARVLERPDPDVALRRKAALKIGPLLLLDQSAMPALLAALKDQDADVRMGAARSPGIYSGPKGPEVLPALRGLQEDKDAKVRAAAAKAIESLTNSK